MGSPLFKAVRHPIVKGTAGVLIALNVFLPTLVLAQTATDTSTPPPADTTTTPPGQTAATPGQTTPAPDTPNVPVLDTTLPGTTPDTSTTGSSPSDTATPDASLSSAPTDTVAPADQPTTPSAAAPDTTAAPSAKTTTTMSLMGAGSGNTSPTIPAPNVLSLQNMQPKVDANTGALTFRIPLDIPPGRNGVQPDIALEYNSQDTQDGIVGYGWDLSIPFISRLNKTGSNNLFNAGYFTSSLDGELATTSTSSPNIYRGRVDESRRTYSLSNNTWTVYDKNGIRYLFGSADQSRLAATSSTSNVSRWYLDEIRDTNDNYAKFTYTRDGNQLYPDTITYTGNGSTDGPFTVVFTTSSRPDPYVDYRPGFRVTTNYRITRITANMNGSMVRQYDLGYTSGNNGTRSLLNSIQESGNGDTSTTLPAMTFSYVSTSTQFTTPGGLIGPEWIAAPGNGNGVNEQSLMSAPDSSTPPTYFINDTTGAAPDYWGTTSGGADSHAPVERGVRYVDVNADGKTDVVRGYHNYTTGNSTRAIYLNTTAASSSSYAWTATSTGTTTVPDIDYDGSGSIYNLTTGLFADANADGFPDFLQNVSGYYSPAAYLGNGSSWTSTTTVFAPVYSFPALSPSGTNSQLADLNGDGLPDWIYSEGTSTYVRLNTGSGWEANPDPEWTIATTTLYYAGSGTYYDRGIRFVDINGDGLPDFIHAYYPGPTWAYVYAPLPDSEGYADVFLNTGSGWATSTAYSVAAITSAISISGSPNSWGGQFINNELANWIGNGQMDQDVISTITYPKGGSSSITYANSTSNSSNFQLPFELLVVSAIVNHNGSGSNEETDYTFNGGLQYYPAYNVPDRKFAGFASSTVTNSLGSTITYFSQDDATSTSIGEQSDGYAQINHPFRVDVKSSSGTLLKQTFERWDAIPHGNVSFLALGRKVVQSYAADTSHRDIATDYAYSSTTDDLLTTTQYGEVYGNSDGTFADYGNDVRTTSYRYASNSSNNLSVVTEKRLQALLSSTTPASHTVNIWLWGGGGGGGTQNGAGGGAGAFVSVSSVGVSQGTAYAIKIGQGGRGAQANGAPSCAGAGGSGYATGGTGATDSQAARPNCQAGGGGGGSSAFNSTYIAAGGGGGGGAWSSTTGGSAASGTTGGAGGGTGASGKAGGGGAGSTNGGDASGTTGGSAGTAATSASGTGGAGGNSGGGGGSAAGRSGNGAAGSGSYTGAPGSGGASAGSDGSEGDSGGGGSRGQTGGAPGAGGGGESGTGSAGSGGDGRVILYVPLGNITSATGGTHTSDTIYDYWTFSADGSWTPDTFGTLTSTSTATSSDTKYYYDNLPFGSVSTGNQTHEEDWESGTSYASSTIGYNSYGLATSSTDMDGATTTYSYDTYNLYPTTVTNALGQTTQYTYDYGTGKVKQTTDPNGRLTKNLYDGVGRVTEQQQSDLSSPSTLATARTFTYTDSTTPPSIVKESDYLTSTTSVDTYTFTDGLNREIQKRIENNEGSYTTSDKTYDSAGMLHSATLPYFSSGTSYTSPTTTTALFTTYAYDALNRVTSTFNAVGSTTNVYSKWTTTKTDANGHVKDYTKDAFGNLASVVEHGDAGNYTTTYGYDALNNLTSITDALSNVRSFTYDGISRRLTATDLHASADGTYGTYTYAYDGNGNLTQVVDPKGQTINRTFDALNRITTEDYTGASSTELTYTYDSCANGIGLLCVASSTDAKITNSYDILGRISTATTTFAGVEYPLSTSYDLQGNTTSVRYPSGALVSYSFGAGGLVNGITRSAASGATSSIASFIDYAPTSQKNLIIYPSGVSAAYSYDPAQLYRLTNIYTAATSTDVSTSTVTIPEPVSVLLIGGGGGGASAGGSSVGPGGGGAGGYVYASAHNVSINAYPVTVGTGGTAGFNQNGGNGNDSVFDTLTAAGGGGGRVNAVGASGGSGGGGGNANSGGTGSQGSNGGTGAYLGGGGGGGGGSSIGSNGSGSVGGNGGNGTSNSISGVAVTYAGGGGGANTGGGGGTGGSGGGGNGNSVAAGGAGTDGLGGGGGGSRDSSGGVGGKGIVIISYPTGNLIATGGATSTSGGNTIHTFASSGTFTVIQTATSTATTTNPIASVTYAYDALGNIIQIINNGSTKAVATTTYTYDALDRLAFASTTAASTSPYRLTYSYDALGNITGTSLNGGATTTYTYAGTGYANPDALTNFNGRTFGYDNNGNLTSTGSDTYSYDYLNRMIQSVVNGTTTSYGYDYQGNRVFQQVGSTTTVYPDKFYSITNQELSTTTTVSTSTDYVYLGDTLVSTIDQPLIDNLATGTPSTLYIHADHLGSTAVTTDDTGSVVQTLDYYPYGGTRVSDGSSTNKRDYIGQFSDDSGLSYLNARYYDASRGQFTSEDPVFWEIGLTNDGRNALANPQSLNSYSYANDNPMVNKDPSGRVGAAAAVLFPDLLAPEIAIPLTLAIGAAYLAPSISLRVSNGIKYGGQFDSRRLPPSSWFTPPDPLNPWDGWKPGSPKDWKTWASIGAGIIGVVTDTYSSAKDLPNNNPLVSGTWTTLPPIVIQGGTTYYRNYSGLLSTTPQRQSQSGVATPSSGLPATVSVGGTTYYRNSSGLLSTKPGL